MGNTEIQRGEITYVKGDYVKIVGPDDPNTDDIIYWNRQSKTKKGQVGHIDLVHKNDTHVSVRGPNNDHRWWPKGYISKLKKWQIRKLKRKGLLRSETS